MTKVSVSNVEDVSVIKIDDGKVNACSIDLLESLTTILDNVPKTKGAVCILGRPGFFSAGFDLKTLSSGDLTKTMRMTKLGFELLLTLYAFPRPVVMGCSGHAVGLGVFLLCCADYRFAVKGDFKVHANEVVNGMFIPPHMLHIAESRILKSHSNRLLLNGEPYPIEKTIDTGLVDELVDASDLDAKVIERAHHLCACQHPFYEKTKLISRRAVIQKSRASLDDAF